MKQWNSGWVVFTIYKLKPNTLTEYDSYHSHIDLSTFYYFFTH